MRYFFHISYLGTNYAGWQRLPVIISIQSVVESALSKVLKTPIRVVGCGRTDSQVHASQYFFHADIETEWDYDLMFRLNWILPKDISIHNIVPVDNKAHARFDAFYRQYDYFFHTYRDAYLHPISSTILGLEIDVDKMKQAVNLIPKYQDFCSLSKSPLKKDHTLCRISSTNLFINPSGDRFRFQIGANRFLSGMIRAIMAQLLNVASGKLSVSEFEQLLINPMPSVNIKLAPPTGLFLTKVTYPYLDMPARTNIVDSEWQNV